MQYVIVKCRPRGVCGIQSTKIVGAKRPSAEWSKPSQTLIGRHLSNIDPKLFTNPIKILSTSSSWRRPHHWQQMTMWKLNKRTLRHPQSFSLHSFTACPYSCFVGRPFGENWRKHLQRQARITADTKWQQWCHYTLHAHFTCHVHVWDLLSCALCPLRTSTVFIISGKAIGMLLFNLESSFIRTLLRQQDLCIIYNTSLRDVTDL